MPLPADLFDYPLPEALIAQRPAGRRDSSRLLVVDRKSHTWSHHRFSDLPRFLEPGDELIRNVAGVLPARIFGQRSTGGRVECLLLRPAGEFDEWWCLLKPGRRLPAGATFGAEGDYEAEVCDRGQDGVVRVRFRTADGKPMLTTAERIGRMPLPPYINPDRSPEDAALDRHRYQTVYADPGRKVAVAAPTAGLHFTPALLARLKRQGIHCSDLILHVGLGTFRPIQTQTIEEHPIHRELYEIPPETRRRLAQTPSRRVAVGTTTVRAIEDYLSRANGTSTEPWIAESALYIHPPATFRGVDILITNFHLPRSTLICLVAAFLDPGGAAGIAWLKEIYADAVARKYRFLSYGDAMLIL